VAVFANVGQRVVQILIGPACARPFLTDLATLDQLVEQEPRIGGDGAVTLVLLQQGEQQIAQCADLATRGLSGGGAVV
jgi:hypothetical protein